MSDINIREIIADSMVEAEREGTYLSAMEKAVLDKYNYIDERDKAFYKKVMEGTYQNLIRIDHIIDSFSKKKTDKLKPMIRAIMRMSVYQMFFLDNVPDSAVCNEAVKLAAKRGFAGLKAYVNGTLRNISRNKNNISYPNEDTDPVSYMSVMYSCPEWIVKKLIDDHGTDTADTILKSYMEVRPLSIRMRSKPDQDMLAASVPNPHVPYALYIKDAGNVSELPGFMDGAFTVQDTGSMMVVELAGIRPGDMVMDLCAAPGGKSIHAADVLCKPNATNTTDDSDHTTSDKTPKGSVYSFDVSESRCGLIRENVVRTHLEDIITVSAHDATVFMEDMEGRADVVIVDAPCSGLGVLGHKSDIRYRIKPEDIDSLASLQRKILGTAVRYVRPGGKLIYSTCTLGHKENDEQAGYVIDTYGFKDVTEDALRASCVNCPEGFNPRAYASYGLQIIPGIWSSDGFYICVLKKDE